jgi:hypothetical protein
MQRTIGCLVLVCLGAAPPAREPLAELFTQWAAAQRRTESLVVEFEWKTYNRSFDQWEKGSGILRLLRTKKGEVFASYDVTRMSPKPSRRCFALLAAGKIYLLDHENKTAITVQAVGGLQSFLEDSVNPFVVLLDRKRAIAKYLLEITKSDEHSISISLNPREFKTATDGSRNFIDCRMLLLRKDQVDIPKAIPHQLHFTNFDIERTIDIRAWRFNPADGPTLEELTRPEDRPGWRLLGWMLGHKQPGQK